MPLDPVTDPVNCPLQPNWLDWWRKWLASMSKSGRPAVGLMPLRGLAYRYDPAAKTMHLVCSARGCDTSGDAILNRRCVEALGVAISHEGAVTDFTPAEFDRLMVAIGAGAVGSGGTVEVGEEFFEHMEEIRAVRERGKHGQGK